jgi:hypothetical protein
MTIRSTGWGSPLRRTTSAISLRHDSHSDEAEESTGLLWFSPSLEHEELELCVESVHTVLQHQHLLG